MQLVLSALFTLASFAQQQDAEKVLDAAYQQAIVDHKNVFVELRSDY
jgi:hypothetical protein